MNNNLDKSIEFNKKFEVYIDKLLKNHRPFIICNLSGNNLSLEQTNRLGFALAGNNYLVQLWMGFTGFDIKRCQMFFPLLERNRSLEQIYLYDNNICDESTFYIGSYLSKNTSLKEFSLNNNFIGDEGIKNIFTALYSNQTLEDLALYGCRTSENGSFIIAKYFESNASLKRLKIGLDYLKEKDLNRIISSVKFNTKLECLEIETHNVSMIDCLNGMLISNKHLKILRIHGHGLNDQTIDNLSIGLKVNNTLKALSIYSNNVSDKGAASLALALHENKGLEEIHLIFTKVTDRVAAWYRKLAAEKPNIRIIMRGIL